jgi:hypothetical protein
METKICIKCKIDKPLSKFTNNSGRNYKRSECIQCANKLTSDRKYLRKTSPAIPPNYICPICEKEEKNLIGRGGKKNPAFVLDHDHTTKKFRGYLCQSCNIALGAFGTETLLKNALNYLKNAIII